MKIDFHLKSPTTEKHTLKCMTKDFFHLLKDFERLSEAESERLLDERLRYVKQKNAKFYTEKDFSKFIEKVKKNGK